MMRALCEMAQCDSTSGWGVGRGSRGLCASSTDAAVLCYTRATSTAGYRLSRSHMRPMPAHTPVTTYTSANRAAMLPSMPKTIAMPVSVSRRYYAVPPQIRNQCGKCLLAVVYAAQGRITARAQPAAKASRRYVVIPMQRASLWHAAARLTRSRSRARCHLLAPLLGVSLAQFAAAFKTAWITRSPAAWMLAEFIYVLIHTTACACLVLNICNSLRHCNTRRR